MEDEELPILFSRALVVLIVCVVRMVVSRTAAFLPPPVVTAAARFHAANIAKAGQAPLANHMVAAVCEADLDPTPGSWAKLIVFAADLSSKSLSILGGFILDDAGVLLRW